MDPVVLAAIIGAVGTCVASVVTWALTRWLNKPTQPPRIEATSRASFEGKWSGNVHQNRGPVRNSIIPTFELKTTAYHLHGNATHQTTIEGRTLLRPMKLIGELISDRFILVHYQGGEGGAVESGTGVLELSLDGTTLKGYFVGVGPFTGGLVNGTIVLNKEGSQLSPPRTSVRSSDPPTQ